MTTDTSAVASSPPGRNDPCHCGSGEKYKRCHLRADDTARSAAVQAKTALTEQLHRRLPRHFDAIATRLAELQAGKLDESRLNAVRTSMAADGLLSFLRYSPTHIAAATAASPTPDGWAAWESYAGQLVPDVEHQRTTWLLTLLDEVERRDTSSQSDELELLYTTAALLLAGRRLGAAPAAVMPLFGEIFLAQTSWTEAVRSEQQESVDSGSERRAAIDLLRALLTGDQPPPLLSLDEWLWLDDQLAGLMKLSQADRSGAMARVVREAAEALGPSARDRAALLSVNGRLSAEARDRARTIAQAWNDAPAKVLLALLQSKVRRIMWRSPEERATFAALDHAPSPALHRDYRRWLADRGEDEAASRLA